MAARTLVAALAVVLWTGCATTSGPAPDPNDPTQAGQTQRGGVTLGQRAASALEGALMGAVIGGQMGPIGAAVGAASAMIYSAITGQVPFSASPTFGGSSLPNERDREMTLEHEIEEEIARQASLESEIEDELARQEDLLREIDDDDDRGQPPTAMQPLLAEPVEPTATETDPRIAPRAPRDRDLPAVVFDEEVIEIRKGAWDNDRELQVVKRTLDADRDGAPEQVRYVDEASGRMIRKEQDRDYDGRLDAWQTYEAGAVTERSLDENDDLKPDVWESYAGGRMTSREVDRNHDGQRDAFYEFENGQLVEERHDTSGDGRIDRVVTYRNRVRVRTEEDTTKDGRMDTWTSYQEVGGKEVIVRIERDKRGDGQPNVFESYDTANGEAALVKREEDVNGDGEIDVTSVYENGKLVRREVTDPALVPL